LWMQWYETLKSLGKPPNSSHLTCARYDAVNWSRVVGFRNIVIHAYFAVDVEIVWTIATQRLAELKPVLEKMLQDTPGSVDL